MKQNYKESCEENGELPTTTKSMSTQSSFKEIKRVLSLKFNNFANVASDLTKPKKHQTIFDLDSEERLQMYSSVNKAKKRYEKKCQQGNRRKRNTVVDRLSTFTKGLTVITLT